MPTFTTRHHLRRALLSLAFGVYALGIAPSTTAASTTSRPDQSDTANGQALPEVTVIGKMDKRTLSRVVNQFIESHAKPSAVTGQVGRWTQNICPTVTGLQSAYGNYITNRISSAARSVGAPTNPAGKKCIANVEVVFTPDPQALLDGIAKKYRSLLGYYPISERKQATAFTHPIQSWYEMGSRSTGGYQPLKCIFQACGAAPPNLSGEMPPFVIGMQIDTDETAEGNMAAPTGMAGSYLSHGLRSEFVHVLVIVDAKTVSGHSLNSVSDYIALLALTRIVSPETCSELPSILNLFAKDCDSPPAAMTVSDTAYLKALYKADLAMNLNIEQGDIRVHMVDAISKK